MVWATDELSDSLVRYLVERQLVEKKKLWLAVETQYFQDRSGGRRIEK